MARVPEYEEQPSHRKHERDKRAVIKPEGRFKRPHKIKIATQRSPDSVTSINGEDMKPILPDMPYIPPA